MKDINYIEIAKELALKAEGDTFPNPLVGAVIVKNGRIIAKGYHRACGADHAEIMALKGAGTRAKGATLYVTLEPCSHFGRTQPCVEKIIKNGIKEVIIGMRDPNPKNNGKSILRLRRAGIKIKVGFLRSELYKINEPFIKYMKHKMPFAVAKCAQTIDGKIATSGGQSKWITSKKARDFARVLRNNFDAILVGANTVAIDNPSLRTSKKTKRLKKIIVDSKLNISKGARLFKDTRPQDVFLATTKKAQKSKIRLFSDKGINVIVCPLKNDQVDLKYLFERLAEREITCVLIEGGAEIIGSALKENLVDKMMIYIAFKIIGDQNALSSINGLKTPHVDRAIRLKDLTLWKIENDLMVEGYVYRNR